MRVAYDSQRLLVAAFVAFHLAVWTALLLAHLTDHELPATSRGTPMVDLVYVVWGLLSLRFVCRFDAEREARR